MTTEDANERMRTLVRTQVRRSGRRQIAIAAEAGCSEKHLSQMLTGHIVISIKWAASILSACDRNLVLDSAPMDGMELANERFRRFLVHRQVDETGISGTGVVAEGVQFTDGTTVMRWCTETGPHSTTMFDNADELRAVHGHAGATEIVWVDRSGEA